MQVDVAALRALLRRLRDGELEVEEVLARLATLPYEDLGFARLDRHRALRGGYPEVVFGPGKTPEQLATLLERLAVDHRVAMATRVDPGVYREVAARLPAARYYPTARIVAVGCPEAPSREGPPEVLVVSAGTADQAVAEEAMVSLELMGVAAERLYDVGVAGLHRLLDHHARLRQARVLVVVAGMEGALPSVVGGLVAAPVIAVPTSVGYGASFGGLAALLAMLNSCASGVAVVNIDNGFGAARLAALILEAGRPDACA